MAPADHGANAEAALPPPQQIRGVAPSQRPQPGLGHSPFVPLGRMAKELGMSHVQGLRGLGPACLKEPKGENWGHRELSALAPAWGTYTPRAYG